MSTHTHTLLVLIIKKKSIYCLFAAIRWLVYKISLLWYVHIKCEAKFPLCANRVNCLGFFKVLKYSLIFVQYSPRPPPLFFFYIKEKLNHRSQAAQKQFKYVCPPFLVVIWRWNILNSHLVWTHLQTSTTFHLTGITWKGLCNIVTILLPHHRSNEFRKTAVQQTEGSLAVWSFFYCVIKLF